MGCLWRERRKRIKITSSWALCQTYHDSNEEKAMENHHFQWENPLSMVIFNSYVKLPEGILFGNQPWLGSPKCMEVLEGKSSLHWEIFCFHVDNIPGLTQFFSSWPSFGGKAGYSLNMVACHDLLCALQRLHIYLGHPIASTISSAWAAF